jgi:hypothetical protein
MAISAGLFAAGVVVPLVLAGEAYPSAVGTGGGGDGAADLSRYVAEHPHALRAAGLFHVASSIPLAIYAASVVARLHALGVRAAGPLIALSGGVLASVALAVSGCAQWVLSRAEGGSTQALAALRDAAFVTGGPWHVMALGLLIAGVSVSAAFHRLLPRSLWVAGVGLAVVCELSTLALAVDAAAYLLPVGRFGGLAWLIAAGSALPSSRPRRS